MKNTSSAWQRLTTAARQVPDSGDGAAPYGFSTRVSALAMAADIPNAPSSLNGFSWRALGFALAVMIVSIVTNYSSVTAEADSEQAFVDPADEVLTLS